MLQIAKLVSLTLITSTLAGCSSFVYGEKGIIKNRDTEYLCAKSYPHLIIPPCFPTNTIHDHYAVPAKCYPEGAKRVTLIPPQLY